MPSNKKRNNKRNSNKNNNNNYAVDDEDKHEINAIVCKKSMLIIFNIFFMVNYLLFTLIFL